MDHALIGNCSYQALVDHHARIDWLCWPRFDSSPVFGGLLDTEKGGFFSIQPPSADWTSEQEYVANTNLVRTTFESPRGSFEVTDFAPRFHQYQRTFKPNMLIRRVRRIAGEPLVQVRCRPTWDYGRITPEVFLSSNHLTYDIPGEKLRLTTNMPLSYVVEEKGFVLEEELWLVLTWGEPLEAALAETALTFYNNTKDYWERWVKHISLPGRFQKQVVRSALTLKLHQYQDTGAITAAATTSLPEVIGSGRNWDYRFCWLRDAYFTLRAMRRIGHIDELEAYLGFIKNIALSNDNLQPVYGISGETELTEIEIETLSGFKNSGPVRVGNGAAKQVQFDVYGEVIAAIAPFFLDFRFENHLSGTSFRLIRHLLEHVNSTMELPDAGIWEIRDDNRVHTFSLLFHWVAGRVATRIGEVHDDAELAATGKAIVQRAQDLIENHCWNEEGGFYADSTTSQNPDAAMLMMINLGYLDKDHPKALRHLQALEKRLLVNGHLMHRYLHHDGLGEDHTATFTVCGFWYVEALARLGFKTRAEEVFQKMLTYANHVGLFAEDIDPKTGDQSGNFPQTYSHVGVINSAFAISPVPNEVGDP
ncbi:MAG: glycoside hydrolase family 15 protein [Polyangiaceae bacterium]|nr:glycoside hydrolase family 15 protein [Polyangiaceae bacterium]